MIRRKYTNFGTALEGIPDVQRSQFAVTLDGDTLSGATVYYALYSTYSMFSLVHIKSASGIIPAWNDFITQYTPEFTRIYKALKADYNPLHNYDKDETITSTQNKPDANGHIGTLTTTVYQTADDTVSTSSPYIPQAKTDTTGTMINEVHNVTKGNIGVMTTQSMITDEVALRLSHNIIDVIIRKFAEKELV